MPSSPRHFPFSPFAPCTTLLFLQREVESLARHLASFREALSRGSQEAQMAPPEFYRACRSSIREGRKLRILPREYRAVAKLEYRSFLKSLANLRLELQALG